MKLLIGLVAVGFFVATILGSSNALASCGVIQKTATASNAQKATNRASNQVKKELNALRSKQLKPGQRDVACVGGAVAIGADGKEIVGNPSCTVTQPFCINP